MAHIVYIRFKAFETFRNCSLFCKFCLLRNLYSRDSYHTNYSSQSLNHHFQHCVHCLYDIFSVFEIAICFCTFWLIGIFYSCDAHDANHGKHSLNHHFRHGAHSLYKIYPVFKLFETAVCSAHFDFFEISTSVMRIIRIMRIMRKQCIYDLQWFEIFKKYCLIYTFWLFRNFYSGDAHDANHGKYSLNDHFRYRVHSVYMIYSVFKLFEIAVCSAHFDVFEITTPVMCIMSTMANIV